MVLVSKRTVIYTSPLSSTSTFIYLQSLLLYLLLASGQLPYLLHWLFPLPLLSGQQLSSLTTSFRRRGRRRRARDEFIRRRWRRTGPLGGLPHRQERRCGLELVRRWRRRAVPRGKLPRRRWWCRCGLEASSPAAVAGMADLFFLFLENFSLIFCFQFFFYKVLLSLFQFFLDHILPKFSSTLFVQNFSY